MTVHCAGAGSTALCGADFRATDNEFITSYMALFHPHHERPTVPADFGINCPHCIELLAVPA